MHVLDRTGRDEHGHRRGARDDQPAAGAPPSRRRVRIAPSRSGPPAARGAVARRRLGERRVHPHLALFRSHHASGADRAGGAHRDARADQPRGHGGGDALARAGCPSGSLRRARRVPRKARVARRATDPRPRGDGQARRGDRRVAASTRRRRRWRDLLGRDGCARALRVEDGHPRRGDAGRQGCAPVGPSRVRRRDRRHRFVRRQSARRRRGSRHRHRHALERLHHRIARALRTSGGALREHQRRGARRGEARRPADHRRCARHPRDARARRSSCRRRVPAQGRRAQGRVGPRRGRGVPSRQQAAPSAERGHRRGERGDTSAGCRHLRRGLAARRAAQAVARARSEAVPRRVRLLVHGLRDTRRHRREIRGTRARGVRHGRRRQLPHDAERDRHRDPGAHQARHRARR